MKFAITVLLLAILAIPGSAQDDKQKKAKANKPDFSGTWRADSHKSEFLKGVPVDRGSKNVQKDEDEKERASFSTLFIDHHDPEFRVVEKRFNKDLGGEIILYSDGRGESNTVTAGASTDSKTKWDGKKLVSTIFRKSKSGKKTDTIIKRITWELSKDGKTLTQTTAPVDPAGGPQSSMEMINTMFTVKTVYQRVSD